MGCYTGYLVRDVDGIWRVLTEKWGTWRVSDAEAREAVLAKVHERGWYLDAPHTRAWWDGCYCRGVLLDMVERRLRVYACAAELSAVGQIECTERRLARAPDLAGWDVGYAWGGRGEFATLVPASAELIDPETVRLPPLAELARGLAEPEWLLDWNPATLRLRCSHEGYPIHGYPALISVIDDGLRVGDFASEASFEHGALPWLTHGPSLLDVLAREVPFPLLDERQVRRGVVIDQPARVIRHWTADPTPPALLEQIRNAWPGWRVERLRFGYAGHLAATGRLDPELLIPDAELGESFDAEWIRERAALPNDPRPLRIIEDTWE